MEKLRKELIKTFIKRGGHCPDIGEWKNQNYLMLLDDINRFLIGHLTREEAMEYGNSLSESTLKRIFKSKEELSLDIDPRKKITLEKLSRYAGYDSFITFMSTLQEEETEENTTDLIKKQNLAFKKEWLFLGLIVGLGILGLSAFFYKIETSKNQLLEKELIKVVQQANSMEFQAYKSIPNFTSYLDSIKLYFWEDGTAYKNILNTLESQAAMEWVITDQLNPSSHELISIKVDSVLNNKAYLSTSEYWRIYWYNIKAYRYEYIYEVLNTQQYLMLNKGGNWKIALNDYEGDGPKQPQRYLTCRLIQEKYSSSLNLKQEIMKAINNGSPSLALKLMECTLPDTSPLLKKVLGLSGRLKDTYKDLNTDQITYSVFLENKQQIMLRILEFVEEI